jgi:hypothetical protein
MKGNHIVHTERMRIGLIGFALLGTVACQAAAASGPAVATATAPNGDIPQHRTFSFGLAEAAPAGYEDSARTFEVERRMRGLIAAALIQKGYVEEPDKGELLIRFGVGNAHMIGQDVEVGNQRAYDLGRLDVDAFDAATKVQLWRAVAVTEIDPKRIDDRILARAVQGAFATFPAYGIPANQPTMQVGGASRPPPQ